MSASQFPWDVLGLASEASEREVRRAYAVRLKQLDTAKNPDEFEELRRAYEFALFRARAIDVQARATEVDQELDDDEAAERIVHAFENVILDQPPRPDLTLPFKAMQSLVESRDYSVAAWQQLLNDPLLDAPEANSAFEYALVSALTENELKAKYTLSAGKQWRDLIESRYAWVSDGLRYSRRFPYHSDLRQALVELRRSSTPIPYSPVPESANSLGRLGTIALVLFLLLLLTQLFYIGSHGGATP